MKTPVTALNATLENMILGVGKYKDYDTYLPECREMTARLADMIHDILETSKAGISAENEEAVEADLSEMLSSLCEPYMLIARAKGISFCLELPDSFEAVLPPQMFGKAVSNIFANAVAYTEPGEGRERAWPVYCRHIIKGDEHFLLIPSDGRTTGNEIYYPLIIVY